MKISAKPQKLIVLVGGGSGGHLTPINAVAAAIKQEDPTIRVAYIGQRHEDLSDAVDSSDIDESYAITAGKFRRYHGESLLSHLLDFKTLALNVRDLFRFAAGTAQAWKLLGKIKPDSIFLKGGFVSVPVGYAAKMRRIPYITHDSDAVPGLANRLTASSAIYNTTALPPENYPYLQTKTLQVGIPLRTKFRYVNRSIQDAAKVALGVSTSDTVILAVGGGLGAQRVNKALVNASKELFESDKKLLIVHITGKKLFSETKKDYKQALGADLFKRIVLIDFTTDIHEYGEAADLVLTRGGATNIAEFAAQAKTCVVVPSPFLTGGQQLHNAEVLRKAKAAVVLLEEELPNLAAVIHETLSLPEDEFAAYGHNIHQLSSDDAAAKITDLLIEISG